MIQGQAILIDNVLAFCNNKSSFKALSRTKGKANHVINGAKSKQKQCAKCNMTSHATESCQLLKCSYLPIRYWSQCSNLPKVKILKPEGVFDFKKNDARQLFQQDMKTSDLLCECFLTDKSFIKQCTEATTENNDETARRNFVKI